QVGDHENVGGAGDVDDAPAGAGIHHRPAGRAAAVEVAVQVRRQQAVPVVVGRLQQGLDHQASGVVDPDVDPAEALDGQRGQLVDLGTVAGVARDQQAVDAVLA